MHNFIGNLDQRIDVQRETLTDDGYGGFESSWSSVGETWAQMVPTRGGERIISEQQRGVVGYDVVVRNLGRGASITEADRLVWKGLTLNVRSAPNAGRDDYRKIFAEANVNT